jgi:hypothetical protein
VRSRRPSGNSLRRRSGGHKKGDPGLLRKTGAYRPDGVRGVGGWGARPPGTKSFNATRPMRFLPGIFSSLRRRAAGAPHCIVNLSVWLPFRVRGHPGKGKGAQRSGPAPLCFLMCPAMHGRGATQIRFAAEDRR